MSPNVVRDMASVNSQTGSAPLMHRTNNGSDVNQGDRCLFTMQSSDNLRTLRPYMSHTCSIGARSGLLAIHGSVSMFLIFRKSLNKCSAVLT